MAWVITKGRRVHMFRILLGGCRPLLAAHMKVFFFFFNISPFFKLEDNCFTMFWWSLPYINVDQS